MQKAGKTTVGPYQLFLNSLKIKRVVLLQKAPGTGVRYRWMLPKQADLDLMFMEAVITSSPTISPTRYGYALRNQTFKTTDAAATIGLAP